MSQTTPDPTTGPIRSRPKRSSQAQREVRRDSRLRQARTCYGHLAGVAGVALMDELLASGWLEESPEPVSGNRVCYSLSAEGLQAMDGLGVDVSGATRSTGNFAFGCLDWTEPGHHLGGSLGRAITELLSARGIVGRTEGNREVTMRGGPGSWLSPDENR